MIIEQEIRNYLDERLDEQVTMEILEGLTTAAKKFVTIEKTGSSIFNRIHHATIAIQSYGKTMYEAAELNERVKEVMDEMDDDTSITLSVKLNSDYNYTDTTTKKYRYQAVYDIEY